MAKGKWRQTNIGKNYFSATKLQVYIKATSDKSAEMVTDEGAIYVTSNRGYNWRAAVQETVSATLNRWVTDWNESKPNPFNVSVQDQDCFICRI